MQLAKLVQTALDETRMLVLGAQILLGFELNGVFRDGFENLPLHARYLDGIALLLIIGTVALLITPETHHHLVELWGEHRAPSSVDFTDDQLGIAAIRA